MVHRKDNEHLICVSLAPRIYSPNEMMFPGFRSCIIPSLFHGDSGGKVADAGANFVSVGCRGVCDDSSIEVHLVFFHNMHRNMA
jgi:hypothetical protein